MYLCMGNSVKNLKILTYHIFHIINSALLLKRKLQHVGHIQIAL